VDLEQLRRDGYTVVEQVVPQESVRAVLEAVREVDGFDPGNPRTWYVRRATVPLWSQQALWDTRQHPAVHAAFARVYGTERLWVTMDRVIIKPPAHPDHPAAGPDRPVVPGGATPPVHWDVDPRDPPGPFFEGVLYLTGSTGEQRGFCCAPDLFRDRAGWLARHPRAGAHDVDLEGAEVVSVAGAPGDLVLYDALLPHGSGQNTTGSPWLAQCIAMHPPGYWGETAEERIARWRGDGRAGGPAALTPLGRRLVGLDDWP